MHYAFTVHDITQYATSFYTFMDIDCMREMFGEDEDYYNQVFSDKELDIPTGRLYGVTTKKDIEKSADVFIQQMMPMVVMMMVVSSLIFAIVMYPLMVSNVSCGMNLHYPWQMYAIVYVGVLVLYFVINGLLTKKLNRVNLAEVLKNRE